MGVGGFLGALSLLLVAAKLFGYVQISWLMALSPAIAMGGLTVFFLVLAVVLAAFTEKKR